MEDISARLDACVDNAAAARRSAAAAIQGTTKIYSFDGRFITTISHNGVGEQRDLSADDKPLPEFDHMKMLDQTRQWSALTDFCQGVEKERPEWLTPYLVEGEAWAQLGQTSKAIPLLKHVRDESGGNSDYVAASKLLSQLGVH
jgi:hypothetical protein